jgi:hypothetical protein
VRVFSPALKPLCEAVFQLPDKSLADGGRALARALNDALYNSQLGPAVEGLSARMTDILREHSVIDARALPQWSDFATQKVLAEVGGRVASTAPTSSTGKSFVDLPMRELANRAIEAATREWNAAVRAANKLEALLGRMPRLRDALHALEDDLKAVGHGFGAFLDASTSAVVGVLPSSATTSDAMRVVRNAVLGQGDLEPGL